LFRRYYILLLFTFNIFVFCTQEESNFDGFDLPFIVPEHCQGQPINRSISKFDQDSNKINRKEIFFQPVFPSNQFIDSLNCPTGHESDVWYMGSNGIQWTADTPRVESGFTIYNNIIYEAQASICDRNGNLLIYTNNEFIYNRYHQVITRIIGGISSSMTLILPQPGQDSIYYVFHPDGINGILDDTLSHKLRYTIINVKSNNYAGSVIKLNQLLLDGSSEKITGIKHCNGKDWWVIGLRAADEAFHAWLLTDTGLVKNNPVVSYSGVVHHGFFFPNQNVGYLKPSHNGSLLVEITTGQPPSFEIHKFNPLDGTVYGGLEIHALDNVRDDLYSGEFSPDNTKLYLCGFEFSTKYSIFQFDVSSLDSFTIRKSMFRLYNPSTNLGSPVLGKDNKIYITSWGVTNLQHVVNNPNLSGVDCDFQGYSFDLGAFAGLGAPLFPSGLQFPYRLCIQGPNSFCADTTVQIILSDPCPHPTTQWDLLGGGQLMSQNGDTIQVYYSDKGNYKIVASYSTDCGLKTDTLTIEVTTCNCYPRISWTRMDTVICEGDRASFQYTSSSTQVLLNNTLLNADTFSISNLKYDTSIQLMIKYPRSCDSIITINIKIHPANRSTEQISFCENDSVYIDNKWIYDTDTLINHFSNSYGCDSTHSVFVKKIHKDSLQFAEQICEGDSVLVFGKLRYFPEILRENYLSSQGCDSVVTYEVKVNPSTPKQTKHFAICLGDSVFINNTWYKDSATVIERLQNQFGCDSTVENIISIYPISNPSFIVQLLCPGDSILIYGTYYKDTISVTNNFQNQFGCDSLHTIQIRFHPNVPILNLKYDFCEGDSTQFENVWIKRDSQIFRTYPSSSMCDSLVIHQFIKLDMGTPTFEKIMRCYEDSFLIQNKWLHQDTNIQIHYQNQNGCDSVHTIDLLFYPLVKNTIDSISICKGDSILINNKWYYDSGQILQKFSNQFGCDSAKQTQILLRPGPEPVELSYYFCQGDSVQIRNNWYYKETNFIERKASPFSCDTVISYHVLLHDGIFVDLGQNIKLISGEIFKFSPSYSSNAIIFKWFPSEGLSCTDCPSPEIKATRDITYYLEVSDKNGCFKLDSITIRVNEIKSEIYFPNVFSPNGDNINDLWMPILSDPQGRIISLSIYDRWGNEVFNCEDITATLTHCGWSGMFKENKCLPGVYVYHVTWKDVQGNIKSEIGDLMLIR